MKQQQKQTHITVLHSDAQADQSCHDQLIVHLSLLQREGLIEQWSDQQILAGSDRAQAIGQAIRSADILLLLLSVDFLSSDICYRDEMQYALERHRQGKARVIPIIVRPCDWQHSLFGSLQSLPRSGQPIIAWDHQDEAFLAIIQKLRLLITQQQFFLAPLSRVPRQNRQQLLRRVRSFWIIDVLEQSLHGAALLALGLQEQPDAIVNPWRLIIQESVHASTLVPDGTHITEVYDHAGGELLILGEPGAGKTTLLLELACDLLFRAEQELAHPIPVVFNLSSWTLKRQSLATWLIEELATKYQVPRKVSSDWINADQILPLLDGLDEVDATSRSACMQAINEYHQTHSLVSLVVCCRVNEYMAQANRLAFSRAVTIQPLTTEQVNEYFAHISEQIMSLRVAFQNDPVLQELATTPLMLTILILAYQGSSLEEIEGDASAEVRKPQIFATYTQRMLRRRSAKSRYGPQQTIHWLSYLARQMRQRSQSVFFLERMQPDWVPKKRKQPLFSALIAGLVSILLFGLSAALIFGFVGLFFANHSTIHSLISISEISMGEKSCLSDGNNQICALQDSPNRACLSEGNNLDIQVCVSQDGPDPVCMPERSDPDTQVCVWGGPRSFSFASQPRLVPWITGTVRGGVTFALLFGSLSILIGGVISIRKRSIQPVEVVKWQWGGRWKRLLMGVLIGLSLGLLIRELLGLLTLFIQALFFIHDLSLQRFEQVVVNIISYQYDIDNFFGLKDASSIGTLVEFKDTLLFGGMGLLVGAVMSRVSHELIDEHIHATPNEGIHRSVRYALMSGLVITLASGGSIGLSSGPAEGLFFGLLVGIITGLSNGGLACIQHLLLRIRLWYQRAIPWNYPSFLDYAVERILLRKVGGGYIFVHRLLLDYFATLDETTSAKSAFPERKV